MPSMYVCMYVMMVGKQVYKLLLFWTFWIQSSDFHNGLLLVSLFFFFTFHSLTFGSTESLLV